MFFLLGLFPCENWDSSFNLNACHASWTCYSVFPTFFWIIGECECVFLNSNSCKSTRVLLLILDFFFPSFIFISLFSSPNWTILILGLVQMSSYNLLRSSGSSRRVAVPNSREAAVVGSDTDPSRPRTTDASPGAFQKISSGQRSSPVVSSENRHTTSGRSTSNIKNFESTLRGIESLHFNNNERVHH